MEFSQIQDLIKLVGRSKISEVEIKEGDFKIIIRSNSADSDKKGKQMLVQAPPTMVAMPQMPAAVPQAPPAPPAPQPAAPVAPAAPAAEADDDGKYIAIKSPMVGTFYRSPSPEKGPFVKIGDTIAIGDTVCIIEAMKLFNEIEAEVSGTIVKVLVEDAQSVEYDQPLFLIDPS